MTKHFLRAIGFGIAGLALGCAIVWFAVSTWDSISQRWIAAGMLLPLAGLLLGLDVLGPQLVADRRRLRILLLLVAIPLGTLGNYLAFVIASRTWFANRIPTGQSFLFQVTHPDALPRFVSKSSGVAETGESWQEYAVVGVVGSPLILWMFTREPRPKQL